MSKITKIILWTAGIAAVVIVAVAVLAVILFPGEKIRALAEETLSESLGMPVSIGSIGLSFAGMPSIKARDIAVGPAAEGQPQLLTVSSVAASVNIFALLSRNIEIASVTISDPSMKLFTDTDGTTNMPPASEEKKTDASPVTLPFAVALKSLSVNGGSAEIDNREAGMITTLDGLEYRMSSKISRDLKNITATGLLTIDDIDVRAGEKDSSISLLEDLPLRFDHEITGDLTTGEFTLTKGDVDLNGMPATVTGSVSEFSKVMFSLATGALDAGDILALVPPAVFPDIKQVTASGSFSMSMEGAMDMSVPEPLPTYTGVLSVDSMTLSYADLPQKVDNLTCDIGFTEKHIDLKKVNAAIGSSRFSLTGTVDDYLEEPLLAVKTTGNIDLGEVADAFPALDRNTFSGKMDFDINARGKTTEPESMETSGRVNLTDVVTEVPETLKHPAHLSGSMTLTPDAVNVDGFTMTSGVSDIGFTGKIAGYPALVWPKEGATARFTGTLRSKMLDLEDMIVPVEKPEGEAKPEVGLEEALRAMPIPPNLVVDAGAELQTVKFGWLAADAARARLTHENGLVALKDINVAAYKGSFTGGASLNLQSEETITYDGGFKLDSLDAGTFLTSLLGLEQPFVSGLISSDLTFDGKGLDTNMLLESLNALGSLTIANGTIYNLDFTRKLGQKLKFLDFDSVQFDQVKNKFRVEDRKFITPDMSLTTPQGDIMMDGYTAFDKSLDYNITMKLSADASQKAAQEISDLSSLLGREMIEVGRLEIPVKATGTLDNPDFAIDWGPAKKHISDRLASEVGDKGEEKARRGPR